MFTQQCCHCMNLHTFQYSRASVTAITFLTGTESWQAWLSTCGVMCLMNNCICVWQHVWDGGCVRTPRTRLYHTALPTVQEAITLYVTPNTAQLTAWCLYISYNYFWIFLILIFSVTKNSMTVPCLQCTSYAQTILVNYS